MCNVTILPGILHVDLTASETNGRIPPLEFSSKPLAIAKSSLLVLGDRIQELSRIIMHEAPSRINSGAGGGGWGVLEYGVANMKIHFQSYQELWTYTYNKMNLLNSDAKMVLASGRTG